MLLAILAGLATTSTPRYAVQPYYVYPADQPYHPEYVVAITKATKEIQGWYKAQVGMTFKVLPLKVLKSTETYEQMRGKPFPKEPTKESLYDMPNWWNSLEKQVGGWKDKEVAWIFAQGGGGVAQAYLGESDRGRAIFGDWVLEPLSGVREPKAAHAGYATWEIKGGTPMGTTAHELGHAFGLHHPDQYPGTSVMARHWDYPQCGLMPHEKLCLQNSAWFNAKAFDSAAPFLAYENPDVMRWGETVSLRGEGIRAGDVAEFVSVEKRVLVPGKVSNGRLEVVVPKEIGPGFLRLRRGKLRSNTVPVNFYPPKN
jgi:hypothetical protein